jgi:hypothetical protein
VCSAELSPCSGIAGDQRGLYRQRPASLKPCAGDERMAAVRATYLNLNIPESSRVSCSRVCAAGLREEAVDGAYTLILEFSSALEMSKWEEFLPKFQSFFGPGIVAKASGNRAGGKSASSRGGLDNGRAHASCS